MEKTEGRELLELKTEGLVISETLSSGLAQYRIGPKIRALRTAKNMGQVQLAQHTGLSPALLSKIERGQLFPTLPTLLRIAMVFGVRLNHFFAEHDTRRAIAITRRRDRLSLPDHPGEANPCYLFQSLNFPAEDRKMEAYYAEFAPNAGASRPHQHAGAELLYVLRGKISVGFEDEEIMLNEGDAIQFDAKELHSYRRQSNAMASAIVVVVV